MKLICLAGGVAAMGLAIIFSVNFQSEFSSLAASTLVMFSLGLVGYGSLVADTRSKDSDTK